MIEKQELEKEALAKEALAKEAARLLKESSEAELLLSGLQEQVLTGGHEDATLSGGSGPYWQKKPWIRHCIKTRRLLIDKYGYEKSKANEEIIALSKIVILID